MQGQWLVYGGLWTGEAYNSFHVFDFNKLAWSTPKLAGTEAHARYYHMAACHNNTLVILGGQCEPHLCILKHKGCNMVFNEASNIADICKGCSRSIIIT